MVESCELMAFVTVTDREAAQRFYGSTLGLRLVEDSAFALVFDAHGTTLRVAIAADASPAPYTVLGWAVPDVRGLADELAGQEIDLERFDGLGGQDARGVWTAPGGAQVAWFKDPHGNLLSITQLTSSG
jgi:catechol 2,3-dioxygenase-like lactoylglutathione lyase family enzyme